LTRLSSRCAIIAVHRAIIAVIGLTGPDIGTGIAVTGITATVTVATTTDGGIRSRHSALARSLAVQ